MRVKQVFKTYKNSKRQENMAKFCVLCGSKCVPKLDNGILRAKCVNCGHINYQNPSPAVSILIVDNSKFLLCKRSANNFKGGKWCLPCGFIEYNEDYLSTAVREVKEETGLDIEVKSIISVVSNFFMTDLHTLVIVLFAKPIGGVLNCGDSENDALAWFSIDEGLPEIAFEADAHIIRRYFKTQLVGAPVDLGYSKDTSMRGNDLR